MGWIWVVAEDGYGAWCGRGQPRMALSFSEVVSDTVFTQFSLEDMTRHLHQWVWVRLAAAFDHARLKSAGAVADLAGGDALQQVPTNAS